MSCFNSTGNKYCIPTSCSTTIAWLENSGNCHLWRNTRDTPSTWGSCRNSVGHPFQLLRKDCTLVCCNWCWALDWFSLLHHGLDSCADTLLLMWTLLGANLCRTRDICASYHTSKGAWPSLSFSNCIACNNLGRCWWSLDNRGCSKLLLQSQHSAHNEMVNPSLIW